MERGKFEDSVREVFTRAEADPGENVWINIELQLEKEKGQLLRRRLFYYQLVAAASVLIAVTASFGLYFSGAWNETPSLVASNSADVQHEDQATISERADEGGFADAGNKLSSSEITGSNETLPHPSGDRTPLVHQSEQHGKQRTGAGESDGVASMAGGSDMLYGTAIAATEREKMVSRLDREPATKLAGPVEAPYEIAMPMQTAMDPVVEMLARLEQRERELRESDKDETGSEWENVWTSVGFSAGSFSATNAGLSAQPGNTFLAMNAPIADREAKASGMSYSMGINLGTRIAERWVLQGGVNVLQQSSEYMATNAFVENGSVTNFRPPSMQALRTFNLNFANTGGLVATAPYQVNNDLRYLTIPIQAGYLIVNRDLGVQLNAGVATDVFLENRISAEGVDQSEPEVFKAGDDVPYKGLNFSGLFGTEISYRFGDHYRVSITPGLRYPFTSIYKTEMGVRSSPLTMDVGLRLRYIFE